RRRHGDRGAGILRFAACHRLALRRRLAVAWFERVAVLGCGIITVAAGLRRVAVGSRGGAGLAMASPTALRGSLGVRLRLRGLLAMAAGGLLQGVRKTAGSLGPAIRDLAWPRHGGRRDRLEH